MAVLSDLGRAVKEIDANVDEYKKAERVYSGEEDTEWMNRKMRALLNDSEDFLGTLNYASIPVDAVADRIQLLSITGPNTKVTEMIKRSWEANLMNLRFGKFVLDVLKYGEYFMVVWPDFHPEVDEYDDVLIGGSVPVPGADVMNASKRGLANLAKIMFADPKTTRAFYDDGGQLMYVARKWADINEEGKKIDRVNLYYVDRIEKYFKFAHEKDVKNYVEWLDPGQTEWPMENPYGAIPVFHFPTDYPYGSPEHKSLYGVQDAINKIFQTHIASIERLGFPIVYMLMDDTSAAGTSEFEYDAIDSQEPTTSDPALRAAPGEVWALRAKSIGQLEPAGSTNFIESLKQYKEIASEISGLPARLFSSTDGQHPGADAVNAADAVLRSRVADREKVLSSALQMMLSFLVFIAFEEEVDPSDIHVIWAPQKMEIDEKIIEVFRFKLALGVSQEQILSEMGYTQEQIEQFLSVPAFQLVEQESGSDESKQNTSS